MACLGDLNFRIEEFSTRVQLSKDKPLTSFRLQLLLAASYLDIQDRLSRLLDNAIVVNFLRV